MRLARLAPELADAVVVDGHTDVPSRLLHQPADLSQRLDTGHVDLPRLREGGVTSPFFALYVPSFLPPAAGWRHAMKLHALVEEQLRPGELELAVTAADVRAKAGSGVVTVLLGLENGRPLAGPEDVGKLAELGMRYVTLTHVKSHEWCDASTDAAIHGGLSDVGVAIVREMRRRGILVDVSHVSDDAALHAMDAIRAPVIASHSSARALCDHPRNLPDSLVLEIARSGGVVMANAYPAFLDPAAARANSRRTAEIGRRFAELGVTGAEAVVDAYYQVSREVIAANPLPPVPLAVYVDHVMHLVGVAGEEHVGIGTDFDGIPEVPVGLEDVSRMPALAEALLERGLPPRGVRMILGENFLRVLEDSERRSG
ncbi:MAG TPA: dipeptidase [Thermoanaerobaculia bacterium]|nr:dipeptidase [Thermoanaerobaculia bacterium]